MKTTKKQQHNINHSMKKKNSLRHIKNIYSDISEEIIHASGI